MCDLRHVWVCDDQVERKKGSRANEAGFPRCTEGNCYTFSRFCLVEKGQTQISPCFSPQKLPNTDRKNNFPLWRMQRCQEESSLNRLNIKHYSLLNFIFSLTLHHFQDFPSRHRPRSTVHSFVDVFSPSA